MSQPPDEPTPEEGGMGRRFVRGAAFVGAANWSTYVLNFGIALVVARLLGPEEFGVYAFVLAINEFVNIVNGLAVAPALVQSREESQELYDTAYAISFVQGLVGLVVSLGLIPFFGHRSEAFGSFMMLFALARFGILLTDVVLARLERQVEYGVIAGIQLATRSLPNFVCLAFAYWGLGAWSLVLRDVMGPFLALLLAHVWSGWWFGGRVRREAARKIFSYSGPMFFARSLDIVIQRLDRLVVGWLQGTRAVGLFHQARFVVDIGWVATTPVSQVTFNLYARLQDAPDRLARAFTLVNYCLIRAFFAFAAVLLVTPEQTVALLLGDEWADAAPVLRALAVFAGIGPVLQNMLIFFYARGAIWDGMRMRFAQLAVLLPGVFWCARNGDLEGVAWVVVASSGLALAVGWQISREVLRGNGVRIFLIPCLALGVVAAGWPWIEPRLGALPALLVPAVPALAYGLIVVACEPRRLFAELRYLRAQFGSGAGGPAGGESL